MLAVFWLSILNPNYTSNKAGMNHLKIHKIKVFNLQIYACFEPKVVGKVKFCGRISFYVLWANKVLRQDSSVATPAVTLTGKEQPGVTHSQNRDMNNCRRSEVG
jgi:hypothetical protein